MMIYKNDSYTAKKKRLIKISLFLAAVLIIILFATKNFIAGGIYLLLTAIAVKSLCDLMKKIDNLCLYISRLELKVKQLEQISKNKESE